MKSLVRNAFQARRAMMDAESRARQYKDEPLQTKNQTQTAMMVSSTTFEEGDAAYAYLKKMAPHLHMYLTRESPVPIDPVMIIQMYKYHGEQQTIKDLKNQLRQDAYKQYGFDHPSYKEN